MARRLTNAGHTHYLGGAAARGQRAADELGAQLLILDVGLPEGRSVV